MFRAVVERAGAHIQVADTSAVQVLTPATEGQFHLLNETDILEC